MFELNNFESIKIALASPEKIRQWSRGEVKKPETINYRTLKPEKDGLFCERIFGPQKDWECHCGKYRRVRYKGVVCDRCGVEVTKAKVRRERMGHIELAAPMSHIWYFKGIPSRMGLLLDMSPRSLEKILYFASYVVVDPGETGLNAKQLLTEKEYRTAVDKYGYNTFTVGMGAEAVKQLLQNIDLEQESKELRADLKDSTGQKRVRTIRRLEVVEAFRKSGNKPEWMILDAIPVIPPDLRPMVQLDGGRFATSDLNDLYRRVINRNNRLKRLLELGAPDIIVRNEKRMLQEAVDALIDNGRRGRPVTGPGNRPLKSLSDMLKGKQGRFRQNLLGKRVDYSGRSVIVVGPELKFYQCGLPKKMALELFKPFVMDRLVKEGYAHNIKSAKTIVEKVKPEVWDVLEEVIKSHPVLLNRAPTLHRLGIQAFEPVLVEGKAIKLHPLVCTAYNADFDGDQMAVHVPLSVEAQAEARFLMLSVNNILAPKDGTPITTPSQDMVLGCYYLTIEDQGGEKGTGTIFKDYNEMLLAYENKAVELHSLVKMRVVLEDGRSSLVESTVGRFIFNENIPQDLGFVDREKDPFGLEVDFLVDKKSLGKIIDKCFRRHGNTRTAMMLDHIKSLGFKFSTRGGITVAVADMKIPEEKKDHIAAAEEKVDKYEKAYRRGLISDEERYERVIETWTETTEKVTDALMSGLERLNNIFIMAHSGARGSKNQIRQLAGMRGLMANASGKTVEVPVKSNFREGLTVMEYFTSSHGARKGLADTALRTADSGYLTRRLVDVSQDVIVREIDCGTSDVTEVTAIKDGNEVIEELYDRIVGRYTIAPIVNPTTGEVIVEADAMIQEADADRIVEAGIEKVEIRTVLNCKTNHGVCSKCYGRNLATGKEVNIGEAVGIIAAQSIGEPGTQLTMRTFHTGGVAGGDITQGLPRVEELFEARKPKGLAVITEVAGRVEIDETGKRKEVAVIPQEGETQVYAIPYGSRIRVKQGQMVEAGDPLTQGSINPHDIVRVQGISGVQNYIVKEVQRVYRMQGVDVNDKHIEVIVRQMLSKVKVEDPGDTELLPGGYEDVLTFNKCNEEAIANGLRPAVAKRTLLGITKASLATESFLSAASFQETTRVLTEAAIKGKEDHLIGLKENVIIGKLIPAGTGMKRYKNIAVEKIEE
ncbi:MULTISPECIES: DNA-directed RNA polymerase subunit beta' [Romboutsia]|uniref:DNA-directed RNA polymerase subunit beta' n=1 Tax=Romboutsia hominis TaxID=1507512 RepID=A0A2P2BVI9_9FIRM|nr:MULTISPECIES: DNA-directed RNA polymerase subunit beta' [Romboutsia]MCH1958813.1 DNA-directed RNA polymerase subunit beta' [Romboutsia hominis]MCH1970728.1 DNA-directed RNA polymerase subunit beta' [Romboutsia hominis]MDB8790091.1 DNA-directed RNA polymerase subunit beta' [Romboutsia sp. 1001216sp1]MDB8794438.1 DNA-directed RNA polymerase subunit beta' [Romboutsia sp. 1001216sp1]MDB8797388.1 DNA-directed RNA polymerase subunit beta' [Romboutsia sp. 1001216sp1]